MIVMKFGGTSVQDTTAIDRTAKIVRGKLGQSPVVVVSAMSKVTDQLLAAAAAAGKGDRNTALEITAALRKRHNDTATQLIGEAGAKLVHERLGEEFTLLEDLLRGIAAVGELTARSNDNVVSFGERMSSFMVAHAFQVRDIPAVHVDSRQCLVTDENYMKAAPLFAETDANLQKHVAPLVAGKQVPVMGGFIGATKSGITTTLGRGGSDFTGAIVGAGLNAEAIEIWTDVDGMMTTDPRICSEAKRIKTISFEEAAELAYFGAKVLHPATLLPAIQKNIPVYVLNSHNPTNPGTKIIAKAPRSKSLFKAIAAKKKTTIIDVVATRMLLAHGFLRAVFEVFEKHRIPVDMVSTSEVSISLTIDATEGIPALVADLSKLAEVKAEANNAIICMVGENIRSTPGIAARVFTAIHGINVRMISQGASEINISFVISEDQVGDCIKLLHKEFFSDADPETFD